METEQETKAVLHLACCMLPKPNRDFMQLLFLFLNHVASFHAKNLMDIHNLAVVLTPGVFYAPPTMAERYRMPRDEIRVVHLLIKYQAEFITVNVKNIIIINLSNINMTFFRYPKNSIWLCKIVA